MDAPATSAGITRMLRRSAVATSMRTKSSGLSSRRRPSAPVTVTQSVPITTTMTREAETASSIACTKSIPDSMSSMSRKH